MHNTVPKTTALTLKAALIHCVIACLAFTSGCGTPARPKTQSVQQPQAAQLNSLSLNPATATIPLGKAVQFKVTAKFSDGSTKDVTGVVSWQVTPLGVATLDRSGTAVSTAPGSATISAILKSQITSASLTVTPPSLVSLGVSTATSSVPLGRSARFSATGTYTDNTQRDITNSVSWSVSPSAGGTILPSGVFTAVSAGNFTVTASSGSVSGTAGIAVNPALLLSVTVTSPRASIRVGDRQQFSAVGTFSDGSTKALDSVTWSTSSPGVVVIDGAGLGTATGAGTATIEAASGQFSGTMVVNVAAPPPPPAPLFTVTEQESQVSALGATELSALQAQCRFIETLGSGQGVCSCGSGTDTPTRSTAAPAAPPNPKPVLLVDYFSDANSDVTYDATLHVTNPGSSGSNVCAEIYVFAPDQQMAECCGCLITPDGLLTLSISDLTKNPLTGLKPTTGTIKLTAGAPGTTGCDPTSVIPAGAINSWATHIQQLK